jgi:hypothetical protein
MDRASAPERGKARPGQEERELNNDIRPLPRNRAAQRGGKVLGGRKPAECIPLREGLQIMLPATPFSSAVVVYFGSAFDPPSVAVNAENP